MFHQPGVDDDFIFIFGWNVSLSEEVWASHTFNGVEKYNFKGTCSFSFTASRILCDFNSYSKSIFSTRTQEFLPGPRKAVKQDVDLMWGNTTRTWTKPSQPNFLFCFLLAPQCVPGLRDLLIYRWISGCLSSSHEAPKWTADTNLK